MNAIKLSTDQKVVGSNPAECTNFSLRKLRRNPSVYLTLGQMVGETEAFPSRLLVLLRRPCVLVCVLIFACRSFTSIAVASARSMLVKQADLSLLEFLPGSIFVKVFSIIRIFGCILNYKKSSIRNSYCVKKKAKRGMARKDVKAEEATEQGRILYSIKDAARELSISRSTLYTRIQTGEVATVRIGNRRLISRKSLERYEDRLTRISHGEMLRRMGKIQ